MQTKDQASKVKNWKVITSVAAASALGLSGLALAGPDRSRTPDRIDLQDTRSVTTIGTTVTVPTTVAEALSRVLDSVASDDRSIDSPFDERSAQSTQSTESVPSVQSAQDDSPDTDTTQSVDSGNSPDDPTQDSPDSDDSVDSDDGSADS